MRNPISSSSELAGGYLPAAIGKNGFNWPTADSRRSIAPLLIVLAAILVTDVANRAAAAEKFWTLSPYEMHIAIAVDDRARPQPALGEKLAAYIGQRIDATLDPLWQAEVLLLSSGDLAKHAGGLEAIEHDDLPETLRRFDKLQTLLVTATAAGFRLECREYDGYARRWGGLQVDYAPQTAFLPEQCFQMLLNVFAPLATISGGDDDGSVELTFKGRDLPRRTDEQLFVEPGDIFQPLLRRTNRTGELVGAGVTPVAWTFLTIDEPADSGTNDGEANDGEANDGEANDGEANDGEANDDEANDDEANDDETNDDETNEANDGANQAVWSATVDSGVRRPFGIRRRGRVQELAIALRNQPGPTPIRFYARSSQSSGLAGYEVYRRNPDDDKSTLLGSTNADGIFTLDSSESAVVTLFLRSDGQLLAKVPVVPGAADQVEVPIADDPARLRAQAELTIIREKMIDLVAQRAILMARTRAMLAQNEPARAQDLVNELGNLPTRLVFEQQIAAAERSTRAGDVEDQQVRTKIEKMFDDTRNLLGRFLDSRPISKLQTEVTRAKQGGA